MIKTSIFLFIFVGRHRNEIVFFVLFSSFVHTLCDPCGVKMRPEDLFPHLEAKIPEISVIVKPLFAGLK